MAQANVIAKVSSLSGEAFARDSSGNLRRLQPGDVIREGETVVAGNGAEVVLTLADGRIRFASTLTFHGVVVQLLQLIAVSVITLGIAYPWMKMRFIRYQATHSHVEGNLDDVALTDHDEQVEKGFIALKI